MPASGGTGGGDASQRRWTGAEWHRLGYELGFGIGIAYGYATLGRVGFEGRSDYTAIGSVVNLAARLCAEAQPGQILVDSKVHAAIDPPRSYRGARRGEAEGFHRPIIIFNVQRAPA